MQVSVEKTKGLERKLKVQVPAERVEKEVDRRLTSLGKRAKIKGFRPGKVPMKVLRQHYGVEVRNEVLSEMIQSTYAEALTKENLNPAASPHIQPGDLSQGTDLEYEATFEVYPEVELKGLDKLKIEQPKVEIGEAEVDAMIEKLRHQRADWEPVDRAAEEGDSVKVDYVGRKDGEAFEGGSAEGATLEIGGDRLVADLDKGLKGLTAGDTRTIKVKFPKEYHAEELAGAKTEFEVTCHEVLERKLPEVDDEFVKSFGIDSGDIAVLRDEVKESMEREAQQAIRGRAKEAVLEALLKKNDVELPNSLVDQEIESMQADAVQRSGGDARSMQERPPRERFEEAARRRVSLGLLIGEIIRKQQLKLDQAKVDEKLMELAGDQANPEALRQIRGNRQLMERVEPMVLEEQVVDWLLEKAQIKEKAVAFDDLMEGKD